MEKIITRVWYNCVTRGTKTYDECPETVRGYTVKANVRAMLISHGYSNLVTD